MCNKAITYSYSYLSPKSFVWDKMFSELICFHSRVQYLQNFTGKFVTMFVLEVNHSFSECSWN